MMLVGNKNDLCENRQVTTEEAVQLAQEHNMAYVETSACTGCNVNSCFDKLFLEIFEECPDARPVPGQTKPVALTKASLNNFSELTPDQKKKPCC